MYVSRLNRLRAAAALQLARAPATSDSDRQRLVSIAARWIALAAARDVGRPDLARERELVRGGAARA